ncbi:hypothetical protein DEU56DRAFT_422893 [Suillus clintonianus]|uniref:uncharacterized protein n=1 Tax=Suillus clintonianus TaxID=1904413 RepID=UPI001B87ECAC|nr:uncharacterized protein DEU56DRAFT_422893 [Suillus clintonianus]KAG2132973.1 hypothetical protein DEU56DRAFT_422893 [Suillus clintonianus]
MGHRDRGLNLNHQTAALCPARKSSRCELFTLSLAYSYNTILVYVDWVKSGWKMDDHWKPMSVDAFTIRACGFGYLRGHAAVQVCPSFLFLLLASLFLC